MRLITLALLLCIPWSAADAAGVPTAPAETKVHPAACQFFIDIIRESLLSELEVACVSTSSSQCEAKSVVVRSILIYIEAQRLHNEDECNTAIEVLERLQALPSQHH